MTRFSAPVQRALSVQPPPAVLQYCLFFSVCTPAAERLARRTAVGVARGVIGKLFAGEVIALGVDRLGPGHNGGDARLLALSALLAVGVPGIGHHRQPLGLQLRFRGL
ncbi:MAG: hypothetical protein ACREVH_09890, partial [Gammaproteobacteria bacterium]